MYITLHFSNTYDFCIGWSSIEDLKDIKKTAKNDPMVMYSDCDMTVCHYIDEHTTLDIDGNSVIYDMFKNCIVVIEDAVRPIIMLDEETITYVMWLIETNGSVFFETNEFNIDKLKIIVSSNDNIFIGIEYDGKPVKYDTDYKYKEIDRVDIHYMVKSKETKETIIYKRGAFHI